MSRFLILALALVSLAVVPTAEATGRRQRQQVVVQKQVVQRQRIQRVVVQQVVVPNHVQQVRVQRFVQPVVIQQQVNGCANGHCNNGVLQLNNGGCSQFFQAY